MNIGKAIKEVRENRMMSQLDVARAAGLTTNTMCNIENNKTFSWTSIRLICKKLNVSIAYLMLSALEEGDFKEGLNENISVIIENIKQNYE